MKKIITLVLVIALLSSCDECKDIACFTPPPPFEFEIVDKQTKENLFTNETFSEGQVTIESHGDKAVAYSFISESNRNTIKLNEIGRETEKIHYTINIADEVIFDLKIDAERKSEDCCTFTEIHSLKIESIEYIVDTTTEIITILVER